MRAVLVPLAAGSATGLFALGGLSAGLAAALGGRRARVALGGATVGVALLVATTAHLATRGGDVTEPTVRPQSLAPPARYAADSADRVRALTVAVQKRSEPQVRYTLLAASRSADVPRAARVMTGLDADTHTRPEGCPARTPRHGWQDADRESRLWRQRLVAPRLGPRRQEPQPRRPEQAQEQRFEQAFDSPRSTARAASTSNDQVYEARARAKVKRRALHASPLAQPHCPHGRPRRRGVGDRVDRARRRGRLVRCASSTT